MVPLTVPPRPRVQHRFKSRLRRSGSRARATRSSAPTNRYVRFVAPLLSAAIALSGCVLHTSHIDFGEHLPPETQHHYQSLANTTSYPEVEGLPDSAAVLPPLSIRDAANPEYWDLTLHEAVQTALTNSTVLRDLGATLLQSPAAIQTLLNPGIVETDPRFGVHAALSAFDAQVDSNAFFEKNDRAVNNIVLAGSRFFAQDVHTYQNRLRKVAATGSEFSLSNNTDYDANNAQGNLFGSAWTTNVEAEVRQPFLQGRGVAFNRIAGPSSVPGVINGVVVARVRTDVALADLQAGLRDFVSNVENAYWDLYFAYRDLQTKIAARDTALSTWRQIYPQFLVERRGGEAEKEAQAREQYFRFEAEVQNALTGRLFEGTRTRNGSTGGTLRGTGGVYVTERRLRYMMGLPISDGRLIRPADEPPKAEVVFDWNMTAAEALARRSELRRQKLLVKQRALELKASQSFLLPRLDAVGRYRWRGFGKDLIDSNNTTVPRFDSAFEDLTTGDFQEWQVGFELTFPIGFRQAHAGVENAQLLLARARAVLSQQEQQVLLDLSNSVSEIDRAFALSQTEFNRRNAARERLAAIQAAFDAGKANADQVLEAQRFVADSERNYYLAMVEYAVAVKNVHFEKGSLLEYNDIYIEGASLSDGIDPSMGGKLEVEWPHIDWLFKKHINTQDEAQAGVEGVTTHVHNLPPAAVEFDQTLDSPPLDLDADGEVDGGTAPPAPAPLPLDDFDPAALAPADDFLRTLSVEADASGAPVNAPQAEQESPRAEQELQVRAVQSAFEQPTPPQANQGFAPDSAEQFDEFFEETEAQIRDRDTEASIVDFGERLRWEAINEAVEQGTGLQPADVPTDRGNILQTGASQETTGSASDPTSHAQSPNAHHDDRTPVMDERAHHSETVTPPDTLPTEASPPPIQVPDRVNNEMYFDRPDADSYRWAPQAGAAERGEQSQLQSQDTQHMGTPYPGMSFSRQPVAHQQRPGVVVVDPTPAPQPAQANLAPARFPLPGRHDGVGESRGEPSALDRLGEYLPWRTE